MVCPAGGRLDLVDMLDRLNRRSQERHRLTLPVELEQGSGVTRDVSAGGVFLECNRSFTPGATIEFTIVLGSERPAEPILLHCRGQVVRVESNGERVGVAATIASYSVETPPAGLGGRVSGSPFREGR